MRRVLLGVALASAAIGGSAWAQMPAPGGPSIEQQQMLEADLKFRLGQALIAEGRLMAQAVDLRKEMAELRIKCGDRCEAPKPATETK